MYVKCVFAPVRHHSQVGTWSMRLHKAAFGFFIQLHVPHNKLLVFATDQSSDSDDISNKSLALRLKHTQQRKHRKPMAAEVLLQGAKQHEELMSANQKNA